MQKHNWQVHGQIMVPAVLKGKLFYLPRLPPNLEVLPPPAMGETPCSVWFCRWILSSPRCLLGQFSPMLPSWKSPGLGGTRDRSVWCETHSCEQIPELTFSNSSNQWDQLIVISFTQSSRFPSDNVQLWWLCFNMLITDVDIITFPNRDYHIGDWCMI